MRGKLIPLVVKGLNFILKELNEIVEKVDAPSSPPRPRRTAFEDVGKRKPEFDHRTAVPKSFTMVYRNPIEKVRVTLDGFGENINKGCSNVELLPTY